MRDDTEKRFTLSAMASQCGFASRTSFFRIFKQITGISPNEYLKSIQ
jgi:AraC-like DNA-binding protein